MNRPLGAKAIILAAGVGSRLMPLTAKKPKCMVEVCGTPILVRMLEHLDSIGVDEATIVHGYKGECILDELGTRFGRVAIGYVENPDFRDTNSMYSLWLARDILEQGCLVIEGDAICERHVLESLGVKRGLGSFWAGKVFDGTIDGCVLTTDDTGRIIQQDIIREPEEKEYANKYKSTSMLSLGPDYGRSLSSWLTKAVQTGQVNKYYDLIIGKNLSVQPIHIMDIGGSFWYEIDTVEDLKWVEDTLR